MGKIKRGVSLYSFQQSEFFHKLDTWQQIREVREGLGTDGIEIISQQTVKRYPFPSDEWLRKWRDTMERYEMQAVAYDPHLDVLQFRDHVMDADEGAERVRRDIRLAKKLGFKIVRTHSSQMPPDDPMAIFERCLPLAEKLDIPLALEIHAPHTLTGEQTATILEYADRHRTPYLGIYPDFGIYQTRIQTPLAQWYVRMGVPQEAVDFTQKICDEHLLNQFGGLAERREASFQHFENLVQRGIALPQDADPGVAEYLVFLHRHFPKPTTQMYDLFAWPFKAPRFDGSELRNVIGYVKGFHGKFYDMTEIPGKPGQYEDISVDYETPIRVLRETGWEGYINSENEGQRHYHDLAIEHYQDEVLQLRRHHEMLARLLGEEPQPVV